MPHKPKKILIIESDQQVIELLRYPLEEEGFSLFLAMDAPDGLHMARREQPNLVILDFNLPSMSGTAAAKSLRRDAITAQERVLMIVAENQLESLVIGPKSAVDDYIIKPFSPVELMGKVKPLLITPEDERTKLISTGNSDLDSKMGGGVPLGSLTLIEGDSGAGKSVLAQQLVHGCLAEGYRVAIFSSENTVKSLVRQMRSLNLDIMDYVLLGNLRIYPTETSGLGKLAPAALTKAIKQEKGCGMVFIDSLTSSIPQSSDKEVLGFFEESKRLCGDGLTLFAVIHSHGLSRELLTRIRSLCDAHLRLRTEEVGSKLVKMLEVTKVRGAEQPTGSIVSFEVEPGWGIRVIPINKVRG